MGTHSVRRWLVTSAAVGALLVDIAVFLWPTWAESLFGFDPDAGGGAFEAAVAFGASLLTVLFAFMAGWEWRAKSGAQRATPLPERGT